MTRQNQVNVVENKVAIRAISIMPRDQELKGFVPGTRKPHGPKVANAIPVSRAVILFLLCIPRLTPANEQLENHGGIVCFGFYLDIVRPGLSYWHCIGKVVTAVGCF